MKYFFLTISIFCLFSLGAKARKSDSTRSDTALARYNVQCFLDSFANTWQFEQITRTKTGKFGIDTIFTKENPKILHISFSQSLGSVPFRSETVQIFSKKLESFLDKRFLPYKTEIYTRNVPISALVPNFYRRNRSEFDSQRLPKRRSHPDFRFVENLDKPYSAPRGLQGRHIALWHSHGWYYEPTLDRWEWQRPRLFQTVEDIYPMAFVLPYLIPMLENAGAQVFVPRERDTQIHEIVVDNDGAPGKSRYRETQTGRREWQNCPAKGFAKGETPYTNQNPFELGTARQVRTQRKAKATAEWIPAIPESGEYAVYVSFQAWEENTDKARYTVFHTGGKTHFSINQKVGGGTWVFLGKFYFEKGVNPEHGKVQLTNQKNGKGKWISADAVRFGGGMGNIARNGKTSGRPRFVEGARYWLQYAGFPDTLTWNLHNGKDDYADDYQCRGEWVNYLIGKPFGPTKNRQAKGLGIPIDLSFAFHTDAGVTHNDSVIGTLGIYSASYNEPQFPDGMSKLSSRDLTDIVQSQIVSDLRHKYDSAWVRRGLWDAAYSEAWRPQVPAMLLELLSHQNFLDSRFGQEPRFRFDVSRAIYKGMLKFLATQHQTEYVVQPLPVSHFSACFAGKNRVQLRWKPVADTLEASAKPENYVVYTRKNGQGFDNGKIVSEDHAFIDIQPGTMYSFKVTAVNSGGESFPSEILSVCATENAKDTVLIVNAFDRTSAPAVLDAGNLSGFANFIDMGVADKTDMSYTGKQYDFAEKVPWTNDDSPGHGASYANYETTLIPGNSFDFPYTHGKAMKNAGFAFVSASDEAFAHTDFDQNAHRILDYILGEEKPTFLPKSKKKYFEVFPPQTRKAFEKFARQGAAILISGAYPGTALQGDSAKIKFAAQTLKYQPRTNHATITGEVYATDSAFVALPKLIVNTQIHPEIYPAEAPDAIEPARKSGATTIFRYRENNTSAAVAFSGSYKTLTLGFPVEAVLNENHRNRLMKTILEFFTQ